MRALDRYLHLETIVICREGTIMKRNTGRFSRQLTLAVLAAAAAFAPQAVLAQAWPAKQAIKAVIPFPPGSTTDAIGRIVLDEVGKQIGQSIIPENRPGAASTTGINAGAKADPDGYTILVASSSFTVVPWTFKQLPYNAETDFAPVMPLANMANVTIVNAGRGYKTAKDLVDAAKKKAGGMNYASVGVGSATHLTAERFRLSAGFEAVHVAHKGTAEALTEILADRMDFYCSPITAIVPLVKEGKITALAVSTATRSAALPGVPTSVEAGYPDSGYDFWVGALFPAKTPEAIVERMNAEIRKALDKPELAKKLVELGADQLRMSPAEFAAMIKREIKQNEAVVKAAGIKPN
jgi:tripartite-type tricarboxylate transporter receptor subunit TctC